MSENDTTVPQLNNKSEENSVVSSISEPNRQKNDINTDVEEDNSNANDNDDNDESSSKKQRTNHRDPTRLANIKSAIEFLLQQENAQGETSNRKNKNLKEVSRQFKIPYNTLRDNFLRATTGQVRHSSVKQVLKTRKVMMGNNIMGPSGMMFSDSSQLFPMHIPFHMASLGMHGGSNQPLIFHPQQQQLQSQQQQQQQQQLQSQQQPHAMAYSLGNGPVIYCMPYNPATMQGKQPNFIRMSAPNNGAAMAMPNMATMSSFQSAATQMHMMSGNHAQFMQNPNIPDMMFSMSQGAEQRNSFSSLPSGSFFRPPNVSLPHLSFEPLPSSTHSSSSFDSSEPTVTGISTLGDPPAWLLPHLNPSILQSQQQQSLKEDGQKEKSDLSKKDSTSPLAAHFPQSPSPLFPPPGDEGVDR